MKVLILGLQPTKGNVDPSVPLLGTRARTTLNKWTSEIFNTDDEIITLNLFEFTAPIKTYREFDSQMITVAKLPSADLTVCLGLTLFRWCERWGLSAVELVGWPHPSPSKRILKSEHNIQKFIRRQRELVDLQRRNLGERPNIDQSA